METFGKYGFNKSHSAAYAMVSYQTAYLKAHYPAEFMAALLTSEKDNRDKIISHIGSCREMGLRVLPPDINESQSDFSVVENHIRFGLAAVKNVGIGAEEAIITVREKDGTSPPGGLLRTDRVQRVNKGWWKSDQVRGLRLHRHNGASYGLLQEVMEQGPSASGNV
jgi:DNA polymerase-3 subunit alpha